MTRQPSRNRAAHYLGEANQSWKEDAPSDALALLSLAFEQDPDLRSAYELSTQILEDLGHVEEARLFSRAVEAFRQAQPFFDLGYHFFDRGHTLLAIPFLIRSNSLRPGHGDTVMALAVALGAESRFRAALQVLEEHPEKDTHFWPFFEGAYDRFLLGEYDLARRALKRIYQEHDSFCQDLPEEEHFDFQSAVDRLEGGIRRFSNHPDRDDKNIRDWHFIQYGGIILDTMDQRYAPGAYRLAGGRFLASWSSPSQVRGILEGLEESLRDLGAQPTTLLHLPDRDSLILGLALGQVLDIPVKPLESQISREECIVVASSSELLSDHLELSEHDPGEFLFTYALNWTRDCPIVPGIAGALIQYHVFPWNDQENGLHEAAFDLPADPRTPEEVAAWILAAEPAPRPVSWKENRDFYTRHRKDLCVDDWMRRPSRERFLSNSPVPGWKII